VPLFTVVIPAYNSEKYIEESVHSARRQTIGDIEIIIVCDPCGDSTETIAEELAKQDPRITVIRNTERLGVAESRNIGMTEAGGEYIAFLDADDVWLEDKLSRQYELLTQTGSDICYSSYSFVDASGREVGNPFVIKGSIDYKGLLYGNVIGTSACVVSKEIAGKHRMDGSYYNEDYVFWLSLLKAGHTACGVTDVLVNYRLSPGSRSRDKLLLTKHRWDTYRKFLSMNIFASTWYTAIGSLRAAKKYRGAR